MAISTADRFEYDIPTQATALGVPPSVLKVIIRNLFEMAPFGYTPDKIYFVEQSKAYPPEPIETGVNEAITRSRLLLNGVNSITIGLRKGEGTDVSTVSAYIQKAAPSVFDLSLWKK